MNVSKAATESVAGSSPRSTLQSERAATVSASADGSSPGAEAVSVRVGSVCSGVRSLPGRSSLGAVGSELFFWFLGV